MQSNVAVSRGRCAWSGADADDLEPLEVDAIDRFGRPAGRRVFRVRSRHREAFLSFNAFALRWTRWLIPLLVVAVGIMVTAAAFMGPAGLGLGLVVLGALIELLPFATPETVEMLGVRKSVVLARGMGVVMMVAGLLLMAAPNR